MPVRPASLCPRGCGRRAVGTYYCTVCEQDYHAANERARALLNELKPLYSRARWRNLRAELLRQHPLCQIASLCTGTAMATEIDHKLAAVDVVRMFGLEEFYNPERLQTTCKRCHSQK